MAKARPCEPKPSRTKGQSARAARSDWRGRKDGKREKGQKDHSANVYTNGVLEGGLQEGGKVRGEGRGERREGREEKIRKERNGKVQK